MTNFVIRVYPCDLKPMSDSPNNIDPKEATEAKLCAYLEGELTPAERAEIEKYLDANPQHRKLLGELSKTREFVGLLPRESAPSEIAEAFHGHVERAMLLDGSADGESVVRLNRWPQFMLAAAIVVLAGGLGVVVYFTLPTTPSPQYSSSVSAHKPETGFANTPTAGAMKVDAPAAIAAPPAKLDRTDDTRAGIDAAKIPAAVDEVAKATEPLAKAKGDLVAATPERPRSKEDVPADAPLAAVAPTVTPPSLAPAAAKATQDTIAQADAGLKASPADNFAPADVQNNSKSPVETSPAVPNARPAENLVYVVLSCADPVAGNKQVQSYLASNQIVYEAEPVDHQGAAGALSGNSSHGLLENANRAYASRQHNQKSSLKLEAASQPAGVDGGNLVTPGMLTTSGDNLYVARALTNSQADQLRAAMSVPKNGQVADVFLPTPPKVSLPQTDNEVTQPGVPLETFGASANVGAATKSSASPATAIAITKTDRLTVCKRWAS